MPPQTEFLLTGFAPLLQILGGICLLFFYTKLIKKSPLKGRWECSYAKARPCFGELVTKYSSFLSTERVKPLSDYLDNTREATEYDPIFWNETRKAIYNLAKFGFFHILFLLAYCGFEVFYGKTLYPLLYIINSIAVIYLLFNGFFYKSNFSQKIRGIYICVSLMIGLVIVYLILITCSSCFQVFVNRYCASQTLVTFITSAISTIAYLIPILIAYFRSIHNIRKCDRARRRVERLFNLWTNFDQKSKITKLFWGIVAFLSNIESFYKTTGREQLERFIQKRIDKKIFPIMEKLMQQFPPKKENNH